MSPKAPREAGIELGRIYCCFSVILIHLNGFYPTHHDISLLWSVAKCASTPVFFLIAGFFFAADKPFSLYMKRIAGRVLIPTLLVMLLIAQLTPWLSSQGSFRDCLSGPNWENFVLVIRIFLTTWPYDYVVDYNPFYPLWFTFALLLCYLAIPFLKIVCAENPVSRSLKRYILAIGVIFFVLRVTLLSFFPANFAMQHLDWWIEQKPFYWLWLMIMGHEIARYFKNPEFMAKWRRALVYLSLYVYLAGGLILFLLTMNYCLEADGNVDNRFFNREFVFYLLAQLGMFLFFASLQPSRGLLSRAILFVANKSFYVYILHAAVYLKLYQLTGWEQNSGWDFLGLGVLTFVLSLAIGTVFKKIEELIAKRLQVRFFPKPVARELA
ncbi:MAG: acyltransferase [Deltaproteobacteria bacterium]|jgi:surface polysaccharide O-acyltransferase-like enzyme|nr:acyltransferase [Deltaproteobacteria bacterium]